MLYFDPRDQPRVRGRGPTNVPWLVSIGARPIDRATTADEGFLFAGARSIDDYRSLVATRPGIRDRPEARQPLLRLDTVLDALRGTGAPVPMPRTWRLPLDAPLPEDISFPLFVRTSLTSWKLGGRISKVRNARELADESEALRRAFGWDELVLAREWVDLARGGESMYGPVPQEVRVWVVDGTPYAWSFHYLNVVETPDGFPPSDTDLRDLQSLARRVGGAFRSRCVVADFARRDSGDWTFIEAGPGSCAGTAHETIFKSVARKLVGDAPPPYHDRVGGTFE